MVIDKVCNSIRKIPKWPVIRNFYVKQANLKVMQQRIADQCNSDSWLTVVTDWVKTGSHKGCMQPAFYRRMQAAYTTECECHERTREAVTVLVV